MAEMTAETVSRFLREGWAVYGVVDPYDGVSAVTVDPDGKFRASLPVDGHRFALAAELGGRAMNLLFPYPGSHLCAHGLVKRTEASPWPTGSCACGLEPIAPNPPREA